MPKRKGEDLTAHPHDAIIKYTFTQRVHAEGLLKAALAPEIAALIRWSTLKLEGIHFVDRTLRGRSADLFFSAKIGAERIYVYVLLEHEREVESLMIFRMGSYMWRQWERLVRDDPGRTMLPPILPVVIHHSKTGWTAATRFEDIILTDEAARAAMLPYIPRFEMKLVDLSRGPDSAGSPVGRAWSGLVDKALTALGRVVLWCLSVAGVTERLESEIDQLVGELNALYAGPGELDALIAVLRYLVATHPRLGAVRIAKMLETTARKGQNKVNMDVLDELKREGRVEGEARMLLRLLTARFGSLPAEAKERILSATEPMLARWSLRVLTAPTLEAVLGATTAKNAGKRPGAARRPVVRKRASSAR